VTQSRNPVSMSPQAENNAGCGDTKPQPSLYVTTSREQRRMR
jgi:hypothetical protein